MATKAKVRRIGDSVGVILGEDVVAALGVEAGDEVFVVRTEDGIQLTPYEPEFAEGIEAGREYMKRHRDALRELAK